MKKIIGIVLIIVVTLNILTITSYAGGEGLKFDDKGDLKFETIGIKATTNIRYRTIGWQIFNGDRNTNNPPRTSSAVIKLEKLGESEDIPGTKPLKVKSRFLTAYEKIVKRIKEENNLGWADQLLTEGGYVYFDPVYTILTGKKIEGSIDDRGIKTGEVYYSLEGEETLVNGKKHIEKYGIKNARGWIHPNDFYEDYNKKLKFPVFNSKITIIHKRKIRMEVLKICLASKKKLTI